jgi:putative two-component system response regulator
LLFSDNKSTKLQDKKIMDSQLAVYYERETGAPFTDSLTGFFNHGFFQISLDHEIKMFERYGNSFTIAFIDVDSFTNYNLCHGPVVGDRLLKEIAGLIRKNIRQVDVPARYSGDVFAVIVTKSDSQQARIAAERIRDDVERYFDGVSTVSIGLACCPGDSTTCQGLIRKAHEALLQAKLKGKNTVHFFEKDIPAATDKSATILLVDDDSRNLKLLEALLLPMNYVSIKALNGHDALSIVNKKNVDLVRLDVMMPGMDGYEVCRRLKQSEETRLIPVVLVTALDDMEAKIKGIEAGADDFLTKPPNKLELLARTKSLINLKQLNDNLASIEHVLFSLAKTVEAKDLYTKGHVERVSKMAISLGRKVGISDKELEALRLGGALHDIGKIGVPGDILNKPGPLNSQEWEVMKSHPDAGYKICLPLKKNLGPALKVIRHHHEKLDGSGYPDGLKGEDICITARIMAVVDIYDALITERPYRKAMPIEEAIAILRKEATEGKLDKKVVGHLLDIVSTHGNIDAV